MGNVSRCSEDGSSNIPGARPTTTEMVCHANSPTPTVTNPTGITLSTSQQNRSLHISITAAWACLTPQDETSSSNRYQKLHLAASLSPPRQKEPKPPLNLDRIELAQHMLFINHPIPNANDAAGTDGSHGTFFLYHTIRHSIYLLLSNKNVSKEI